ncbi:MAG: type I-G CRISPR-associated protein Cas8g2 [Pyrinomonadaceae bacterium]
MAEASISVDLFNPGQVFACLGFLEAADVLLGDAEGGFEWTDASNVKFHLSAAGTDNPFAVVLEFLAQARPERWGPIGYIDTDEDGDTTDDDDTPDDVAPDNGNAAPHLSETFPASKGERLELPIRLGGGSYPVIALGHWADGSSRTAFKLYSGNRSADGIANAILQGARKKPKKKQTVGDVKTKGVSHLWQEQREAMIKHPLDVLTPMGGSFNFDPRGAWTAIDAGYSPNDQKHLVSASPVVEILAAWGMENARPDEFATRKVRYSVWGLKLPPVLARLALIGGIAALPQKFFRFELAMSGKNKVVNFAQQENES